MSKTDHARIPGTHRVGHARRAWRKEDGESLAQRSIAKREAIEEGLMAHLDMDERASQVLVDLDDEGERMFQLYAGEEPVAQWEWTLLGGDEGGTKCYADYVDDFYAMLEERADVEDFDEFYGDPAERGGLYGDDPDEDTDLMPWLPCMSVNEAYDVFGGDGFLIEGPRMVVEPKRANDMRAWQLAQGAGVPTKALIDFLRINGEYVKHPQSFVAMPVCERVLAKAAVLRMALG